MDIQQANFIARHFVRFDPLNHLWIDAVPGISHRNAYPITALCNADGDNAFTFARLDTVDNGVFHQRLDQQAGNAAIHLFINIIDNRQLVAKAGLLNGNIVFNLIQLFFDIDLLIVFNSML